MTHGDAPVGKAPDPNDWDHHWDAYGEASERSPAVGYRLALILKLLGRPPAGSTVLDIGSGQGQFALRLQAMYPDLAVWGVEYSAVGVARSRELAAQRGSAAKFRRVDLLQPTALADGQRLATHAVCSEVLEHVADPVTLIRHARALLAPGCHLVVTVPGGPRSAFDRHIGHFQHFTARKLRQVLTDAGYEVQRVLRAGFPFFNLYKLALIARGKKFIADLENRSPGEALPAESMVKAFFDFGLRRSVDNSPFGWQMVAVATVPGKDGS
ncbi:class I SAM-dependent methyltransferase [Mycobacterium seoulense]|uniref:class I SAM-dependent methyltransferase n=1 Tax=Mycobacterium seoulense TaxID=386911 RepID=UPI003CEC9D0B